MLLLKGRVVLSRQASAGCVSAVPARASTQKGQEVMSTIIIITRVSSGSIVQQQQSIQMSAKTPPDQSTRLQPLTLGPGTALDHNKNRNSSIRLLQLQQPDKGLATHEHRRILWPPA
jgi:hypothetical protein